MSYIANAEAILAAADIVAVIASRVPLTQRGAEHQACCPFHTEKTPSFKVNAAKGLYKCFGCDKGGDVVKFLREFHGIDFPAALEMLAAESGVRVMYDKTYQAKPGQQPRQVLYDACKAAAEHYHANLDAKRGKNAVEYIEARGFSATIKSWQLGYAIGNTVADCFDAPALHQAGILNDSGNDPLAGRLIIPLRAPNGLVCGFTGRSLPGNETGPKYINTTTTDIYTKGANLFGPTTRPGPDHPVYLLEGQLKAIANNLAGFYSYALGGTAFTTAHAAQLKRICAHRPVILALDPDDAGNKANIKAAPLLRAIHVPVKVGQLVIPADADPDSRDPDELIAQALPVMWTVRPWIEWALEVYVGADLTDPAAQQRFLEGVLPTVNAHPNELARWQELKYLAGQTGTPADLLSKNAAYTPAKPPPPPPLAQHAEPIDNEMSAAERYFLTVILQHPPGKAGPNWWTLFIPWLELPLPTLYRLQTIAYIQARGAAAEIPLATAIAMYAPPKARDKLLDYLTRDIGDPADVHTAAMRDLRRHFARVRLKAATDTNDPDHIAYVTTKEKDLL